MTQGLRALALACALTSGGATVALGADAPDRSDTVNLTKGESLNDTSVAIEVRVKRAKALGSDKSPAAIDTLLGGLDSRSEELRAAIIASLHSLKADQVLLQRAADPKRAVPSRVAALAGVRVLKPGEPGAGLAALLIDKDEAIREAAAHTLCVVGTAAAEAALIAALKTDASPKVRYFVAVALGELKTPAAKAAVAARRKTETDVVVQDALDQAETQQNLPPTPAPKKK